MAFYDVEDFEWAQDMAANWMAIRAEYEPIYEESLIETDELYAEGGEIFALYYDKERVQSNCALCPVTTSLLEMVPNIWQAAFVTLNPQSNTPSNSRSEKTLRLHMGLIVPEKCGMIVDGILCPWIEGGVSIFDESLHYSGWNTSKKISRVIFMIDFYPNQPLPVPMDLFDC
jgi:beta-hydroxylase